MLDLRIGDPWTREPNVELLAELDVRGLALEQPDPRRAVWVVVESEAAREERRREAAREFEALTDWREAG